MEPYLNTLKFLMDNVGLPGAIVAASYFLYKAMGPLAPIIADWLKGQSGFTQETNKKGEVVTLASIDDRVKLLATNHFHEVKDSLERLEGISREQTKLLYEMRNDIAYMRGRTNGRE